MEAGPIYLSYDPADAGFVLSLRAGLNAAAITTIENDVAAMAGATRFVACFSGRAGDVRHNAEELRVAMDHRSRSAVTSGRPWLVAVKASPCDLSFIPLPPSELETIESPASWKEAVLRIAGMPAPERGGVSTAVAVDDLCIDGDANITNYAGSGDIPHALNAHSDVRARRVAIAGSFNLTTASVDESLKKGQ